MEGEGSGSDSLPEVLEFEGRFMSSCPITNNSFWWHNEQNAFEQQLPDFIPVHNETGASHQSLGGQAGWNAERLSIGQSSSRSIKYGSDYSEQMEFENTSGVGSSSNILPYQPTAGTYQVNSNGSSKDASNNSLSQPTKDLLTNAVPSVQSITEHIETASSSAHTSMNFLQTGIIFREESNRPASAVVTTHPSVKRKSPECWDEYSAMASKRSVQDAVSSGSNAGSSGSNAASSSHIPCDGLSSGTVPAPRSSFFDIPPQSGTTRSDQNFGQNCHVTANSSVQGSVPANFALSETVISQNINSVVQNPGFAIPPLQASGEGSNVQNYPMIVQCPVTLQQDVHFAVHHSRNTARNSSGPDSAMGITQMEEMRFRNATQSLQRPVVAPPVGLGNLTHSTINFGPSGGDESIDVNTTNLGAPPPDPNPNLSVLTPNLNSNSYRRRRFEIIRQALLDVDSLSGASTSSPPEVHLGITPETRQRLISRARHLITMYRGGRDMSLLEDGANARQLLVSALASIHDQHRDMRLDVDNMSYEELLELGERIGDVKTGLSEETIMDSLKCSKYTFAMKSNQPNAEPCSICREEYAGGEDLGTLDCGHEYHTHCIKQWLVLKNSCPICKAAAAASWSNRDSCS